MAFLPLDTKYCKKGDHTLSVENFHKLKASKDGLQHTCKDCNRKYNSSPARQAANKAAIARSNAKKILENPHYIREKHLKKQYGIDYAEYQRMFVEQDGKCPCGRSEPKGFAGGTFLHVDHDHETGAVRGLLCPNCNKVLGLVFDNPDTLIVLAAYLIKAKEEN